MYIQEPGLLTTVQDLGRTGYRHYGIAASGAMDSLAARVANLMLGNPANAALVEYTLIGPTATFTQPAAICLTGGHSHPTLDDIPIPTRQVIFVAPGQTLKTGAITSGCRGYLAIRGGFTIAPVLESCSTYLRGEFGGLNGQALQADDHLEYPETPFIEGFPDIQPSYDFTDYATTDLRVRYIAGIQSDWFTEASRNNFRQEVFTVTPASDRMGYRLSGPQLCIKDSQELLTEGVCAGTVQIPANGQPIILMQDCQTTGGYPKIGQIISADLPRVAQLKPGDTIQFTETSVEQAQKELVQLNIQLNQLAIVASYHWSRQPI